MDVLPNDREASIYKIGNLSVQHPEFESTDKSAWADVKNFKRSEIEVQPDPPMRGDDPYVLIDHRACTGRIVSKGCLSARKLYVALLGALCRLTGSNQEPYLKISGRPTHDEVHFTTEDPDVLLGRLKNLREEGWFDRSGQIHQT